MRNLQINCPEGYEIDQEKSNLDAGIIYFKEVKKEIIWFDIGKKLFDGAKRYFIDQFGMIHEAKGKWRDCDLNASTTKEQLDSILALNLLCNVAKYLNGDWLPDWNDVKQEKYYMALDYNRNQIEFFCTYTLQLSAVYFKSEELNQQAINILGEKTIKKALTLNN